VYALGGAAEVEAVGDGDEVAELLERGHGILGSPT
jgi:hypothetical protein